MGGNQTTNAVFNLADLAVGDSEADVTEMELQTNAGLRARMFAVNLLDLESATSNKNYTIEK